MDIFSVCKRLISADSGKGADRFVLVQALNEICQNLRLHTSLVHVDGRPLFFVAMKTLALPRLAYISQLETYEHGPASIWKKTGFNPLQPTLREDRLYGLGAATGKADFAAKLKAVSEATREGMIAVGCLSNDIQPSDLKVLWARLGGAPQHLLVGAPSDLNRIDWSTRQMTFVMEIPFPESEKTWNKNHAKIEGAISQTRFFSGADWVKKMKTYMVSLPSGTGLIKISTNCNELGFAIDGEVEVDLSRQFEPSTLERAQTIMALIQQLETELTANADVRSGLSLGKITTDAFGISAEIIVQSTQTARKPILRIYLDQLQSRIEAWGGQFLLKDFSPMFQLNAREEFIGTIDEFAQGVRTEKFQFRQYSQEGMDVVAIGPGSVTFEDAVESVAANQIEQAKEMYRKIGERILQ